jgi:hypothetical protein
MLTKTEAEIMKLITSKITERFSIKQIAELIKKPYPLVHRSIKQLLQKNTLMKDEKGFIILNLKENHAELAYVESLRAKEFLKHNKTIHLFAEDVLGRLDDFLVLLIFGSVIEEKQHHDVDVLFITSDSSNINDVEKKIRTISSTFTKDFDINVISKSSAYEMLSKRDQKNVLNESLNKHILLFGAENYYRFIENAR